MPVYYNKVSRTCNSYQNAQVYLGLVFLNVHKVHWNVKKTVVYSTISITGMVKANRKT